MSVATDDEQALMVVTDGGFGKRTLLAEYPRQGRGGKGVLTARIVETRGELVGAMVVGAHDELFAITSAGVVIRMSVDGLRNLSRATMGVKLISLDAGATVVAVAHNGESTDADDGDDVEVVEGVEGAETSVEPVETAGVAPDEPSGETSDETSDETGPDA
jgi:DNA gyrase subunit A